MVLVDMLMAKVDCGDVREGRGGGEGRGGVLVDMLMAKVDCGDVSVGGEMGWGGEAG